MTDTGKVKPEADPVQQALSRILKLGAGGTFSVLGAMLAMFVWIKSELNGMVRDAVREVVRAELTPIEKRLQEIELDREVERRIKDKEK